MNINANICDKWWKVFTKGHITKYTSERTFYLELISILTTQEKEFLLDDKKNSWESMKICPYLVEEALEEILLH